jgi:hypothetical protein
LKPKCKSYKRNKKKEKEKEEKKKKNMKRAEGNQIGPAAKATPAQYHFDPKGYPRQLLTSLTCRAHLVGLLPPLASDPIEPDAPPPSISFPLAQP